MATAPTTRVVTTHPHSRTVAIATGALVDVTPTAHKMRFRVPVAVTRGAWEECVHWDDIDEERKAGFSAQDVEARLHDLVWFAICAARQARSSSRAHFDLMRVPRSGSGCQARSVTLSLAIEPGDRGEPVVTIALPGEEGLTDGH